MSAIVISVLRAAVLQAISILGEKKTRQIIEGCFDMSAEDHWGT